MLNEISHRTMTGWILEIKINDNVIIQKPTVIIGGDDDSFVIFTITLGSRIQYDVSRQQLPDRSFVVEQHRLCQVNW